jgi:hypothetical protein
MNQVEIRVSREFCQFHAGFLLGLFVEPEDGGDMASEVSDDFQQNTRRYIPEESILQSPALTTSDPVQTEWLFLSGIHVTMHKTILQLSQIII